ncbi:hypothetical protein TH53_25185 [Pedobacter lusitanus]|uniref:Uncharacterized protein n=1 Tax=Pedobacter lusitanus TaxID=1503925 RepID=A0A0D0EZ65_9SPHI|nr:hypothetical protein [Pedobacter lusitanus]KIO74678.1 hypothetical protein TH53_25185 [Pedobacter lusitanus]
MITLLNGVYNKPLKLPDFTTVEVSDQDLEQYSGIYSTKEIPVKITITKKGKIQTIQATGQPTFVLDAKS